MALTQENILGSFLPTINISKIILNNSRVDLQLVIIDTEADEGIFSIINDKFLRDCITIKVFQSTDPETTEKLLNPEENIETLPIFRRNTRTSNFKEIPITNSTKFETDEDGNRKLYYDLSFDIDTSNIEHLSYVVYSDIDLNQLRRSFQIVLTPEELKDIPRKISVDVVIEESKIVSTSYLYQLPDGNIWTGEVINVNGMYETLEEQSRILTEIEIPNYKIQDFRLRNIAQKNSVSEKFIKYSNLLIQDNFIAQSNLNFIISKPKIFENVEKYSNTDKTVSISVLIDFKELIKQNCLYPKLLPTDLNEDSFISSMSLYRKKIKSITKNDNKMIVEDDESVEPELILNNFKNYKLDINKYSKHYLFKDQKIRYISDGKYQYGIQINFLDPTIIELKKRLANSLIIRKNMIEYYSFCQAFLDPETNSFKKEVAEAWDPDRIDEHAEAYIQSEINKPISFKAFLDSLKRNISPINGTLEGIYLFIKIIDDLISDISSLLSITNTTSDVYEFNKTDVEQFSIKSSVEFFQYFKEAIHDIGDFNKVELSYFDINDGRVGAFQLSQRIFPTTSDNQSIYLAPRYVILSNKRIDLTLIESEPSETIRKQKYISLKNKIINIIENKSLYIDYKKTKFFFQNIQEKTEMFDQFISDTNEVIQKNIFNDNSVIVESNADDSKNYNKFLSLDRVMYPENTITIPEAATDANMLKNLTIDLADDENKFKYLMLTKIEFSTYDENIEKFVWRNLTLQIINELNKNKNLNILCRLIPCDYSSFKDVEIKNINDFNYNKYFVLNLQNFNSTTQFVQPPQPPQSNQEEKESIPTTQINQEPAQLPSFVLERPIRLNLKEEKNIGNKLLENIRNAFDRPKTPSELPRNNISRTNIAISSTPTQKIRNTSAIRRSVDSIKSNINR